MNYQHKILIVEDDRSVRILLRTGLVQGNYTPLEATTGAEALEILHNQPIDLVILDLGLPDMDGCAVIEQIRSWTALPILVVSARTQEQDKIKALDLGADDYLTKPFSSGELLARIRTCLRRVLQQSSNPSLGQSGLFQSGDLTVDFSRHLVSINDSLIHLTQSEYRILSLLARHSGRVLTYDFIMRELWGGKGNKDTQTLRVYMANIRRKIEKNPAMPIYLHTEVGVGYRLMEGNIQS